MTAPFSVALPTQLRRRGEIVGLICGVFCFPFAFFGEALGALLPAGPAGVILPIVFFSTVAEILACMFGRGRDEELDASVAPRVGIRAGLVASLTGGSLSVFAATMHAFNIGHAADNGAWVTPLASLLPRSKPGEILVIALLGVPPAVFFGMAGALVTAIVRAPQCGYGGEAPAKSRTPTHRSALFSALLVLSAIGYLSPFTLPLRPKPKPIVVAPPVQPSAPAPPPKWHYEKPAGFDTAEAGRMAIVDRHSIGKIDRALPVALSPDGRLFAYCRSENGIALQVCDLESLDVVASVSLPETPANFVWSPDGKMLLLPVDRSGRRLLVFDTDKSNLMLLPQQKNGRVPEGVPNWWEPQEVLFIAGDGTAQMLNLDTLRVHSTEDSPLWKALAKSG